MSARGCSVVGGRVGSSWFTRARTVARDLPPEEAETVEAGLRHIAFLDKEIEQVERLAAKQLLGWPEAKRLLTVPGVNLIAAGTSQAIDKRLSGTSVAPEFHAEAQMRTERQPRPETPRRRASRDWRIAGVDGVLCSHLLP